MGNILNMAEHSMENHDEACSCAFVFPRKVCLFLLKDNSFVYKLCIITGMVAAGLVGKAMRNLYLQPIHHPLT